MAKYVNKESLSQTLMQHFNLNKSECSLVIDLIFDEISSCLAQGGIADISSFGKFEIFERKERNGINPRTLEAMTIPKRNTIKFRASSTWKHNCNQ